MLNRRQSALLLLAAAIALLESIFLDTAPCGVQLGRREAESGHGAPNERSWSLRHNVTESWSCGNGSVPWQLQNVVAGHGERYLTFQPPGNGWNNQRQAMETALVLAWLLKRTLIVHPMSPHELGLKLKRPRAAVDGSLSSLAGYEAYNAVAAEQLTPIGRLLDLEHMSLTSGVPVVEWCDTQKMLHAHLAKLKWLKVCHSGAHGFWIDRFPSQDDYNAVDMLQLQMFEPTGGWDNKCNDEIANKRRHNWNEPVVRSVLDLMNVDADVIYITEGTLFGIDLRFIDKSQALTAQRLLLDSIRLEPNIVGKARRVVEELAPFNAVHVRRGDHQLRYANSELWLKTMAAREFLGVSKNLYVSTDEQSKAWFQPFRDAGYTLTFASDMEHILQTKELPDISRQDVTSVFEQAVLIGAGLFVPSPHSTFSAFVLRSRNETEVWDSMLTAATRIKWAGHTLKA